MSSVDLVILFFQVGLCLMIFVGAAALAIYAFGRASDEHRQMKRRTHEMDNGRHPFDHFDPFKK
jgi:hypothetical protein